MEKIKQVDKVYRQVNQISQLNLNKVILDILEVGVVIFNLKGTIIHQNDQIGNLLNLKNKNDIFQKLLDIIEIT